MRSSIATYKASLSRLANEVLDAAADDDLQIPQRRGVEGEDSPESGRRLSRRQFSPASPPSGSPVTNGFDADHPDEMAIYKADILKLQQSEAEIRALSVNYAAMLKEKEEQLSNLREENGSLRKSLEASTLKGTSEKSPSRRQRHVQENFYATGIHSPKANSPKQGSISNGTVLTHENDVLQQNMELKSANSQNNGKVFPDLLQENNGSLATLKADLEAEVKQLRTALDNEHKNAAVLKQKLQEECQLNESSFRKLNDLRMDKERSTSELKELRKELNEKISRLGQLEAELKRRDVEQESNISLENAKRTVMTLEKDNAKLKIEKDELEHNLKLCMKSASEKIDSTEGGEKMVLTIRKLEEALKDACKERDKALQESARLKQHLLEKELEDSDKMDEDSKMIEDLRANCEVQRSHILQLEKALKQEIANGKELKKLRNDELQKSHEAINDLKQNLAHYMSIVDSKNVELLNLQTALGQYYAESEAKERLGRDLAMAREESAKLFESLKVAKQELEVSKREKEEITAKLTQTERMLSEGKRFIQKLEEDNTKLRRALEQSMTTLNRMSLDSDNYVDRRIVIKLLVTYFQRNHSKEVLDLMVRMLGFTEEDKQRIGFAQNTASKGIVRGVLGLPGRVVGGILGGNSPETPARGGSDNQSFADLWVDFLLKETEERERRESSEASEASSAQDQTSAPGNMARLLHGNTNTFSSPTGQSPSINQTSAFASKRFQNFDHPDSEFSTVPLTSSVYSAERNPSSRLPSKYGI